MASVHVLVISVSFLRDVMTVDFVQFCNCLIAVAEYIGSFSQHFLPTEAIFVPFMLSESYEVSSERLVIHILYKCTLIWLTKFSKIIKV